MVGGIRDIAQLVRVGLEIVELLRLVLAYPANVLVAAEAHRAVVDVGDPRKRILVAVVLHQEGFATLLPATAERDAAATSALAPSRGISAPRRLEQRRRDVDRQRECVDAAPARLRHGCEMMSGDLMDSSYGKRRSTLRPCSPKNEPLSLMNTNSVFSSSAFLFERARQAAEAVVDGEHHLGALTGSSLRTPAHRGLPDRTGARCRRSASRPALPPAPACPHDPARRARSWADA